MNISRTYQNISRTNQNISRTNQNIYRTNQNIFRTVSRTVYILFFITIWAISRTISRTNMTISGLFI